MYQYVISYTDSLQCIWAYIHGLCSYDHEALVYSYPILNGLTLTMTYYEVATIAYSKLLSFILLLLLYFTEICLPCIL